MPTSPLPSRLPPRLVCLVTDRRRLVPDARTTAAELAALEALIDAAIDEAVDIVQVRERDAPAGAVAALVRRLITRRGARATRVLVNDRADVALAAGADGVHLRADSAPAARVRMVQPAWIVGRSVHPGESRAMGEEIDYVLFGTVFASVSKPGHQAAGLAALADAVSVSPAPVIAIGGISTAAEAEACVRAGATGVAAIGMFLPEGRAPGAIGVQRAVRLLSQAVGAGSAGATRFLAD